MSDNGAMCLGLHLGISYGRCGLSFVHVFCNNTQKAVSFEVGVLLRFFKGELLSSSFLSFFFQSFEISRLQQQRVY